MTHSIVYCLFNDFSFLFVVPVVRVISTTVDRGLRNIAVTSVVVTSIVSAMISLVGIETGAIARVVVLVAISSSKGGDTKSKMLRLEKIVKPSMKSSD